MATKTFWRWFGTLVLVHLGLFVVLPLTLNAFEVRMAWFSVNVFPWYPLHWLGVPVTDYGWLTLPNVFGWLWCIAVWAAVYALVATAAARLTSRRTDYSGQST